MISTHAIAMKGLLEYLTPESQGRYWSKYIGNCAVRISVNQDSRSGRGRNLSEIPAGDERV